ncbi:hypothetical protein KZ483_24430 [Paenibacillus sp. sptzw28]|nr:hypothetical protein [Paenibacillus sp. sptzw28]QYR20866.1 hypothetical protein KZ483_24430 [Paenibacillus sp. sptzw28]
MTDWIHDCRVSPKPTMHKAPCPVDPDSGVFNALMTLPAQARSSRPQL